MLEDMLMLLLLKREITMSRSHKMVSYKKVKRLTTPEYFEELFKRKTDLSKETIR